MTRSVGHSPAMCTYLTLILERKGDGDNPAMCTYLTLILERKGDNVCRTQSGYVYIPDIDPGT